MTKKRTENNIINKTFNELLTYNREQTIEQPQPDEPTIEEQPIEPTVEKPDENSLDYLLYSGNPYKPFPKTI